MHDAKGRELKVGDVVMVPFKVLSVHATEDFCNLSIETIATMPPEHKSKTRLDAINTKQTLRANEGDDVSFATVYGGMGEVTIR